MARSATLPCKQKQYNELLFRDFKLIKCIQIFFSIVLRNKITTFYNDLVDFSAQLKCFHGKKREFAMQKTSSFKISFLNFSLLWWPKYEA